MPPSWNPYTYIWKISLSLRNTRTETFLFKNRPNNTLLCSTAMTAEGLSAEDRKHFSQMLSSDKLPDLDALADRSEVHSFMYAGVRLGHMQVERLKIHNND